jgi:hypothetical protein
MAAKKQVIAILFAAFLIMLCISVKTKGNSALTNKILAVSLINRP